MNQIKTYSYPEARSIVVCGDIHGDFNTLIHKMCIQYQMTDTLLIVAGDCGLGFEKPAYYDIVRRRISARLSKAGNRVLMVRGNHDDPAYFNEERIANARFRTIPDYSVIQACGHNILCVGGAISIDREARRKRDAKNRISGVASYWPDEAPVYNAALLDEIGAKGIEIDSVITHSAPSFCELITKDEFATWLEFDPDILPDCAEERKTIDLIFKHLKEAGHPLSHWFYGHFHQSWSSEINGVLFSMLDIMEFKELR